MSRIRNRNRKGHLFPCDGNPGDISCRLTHRQHMQMQESGLVTGQHQSPLRNLHSPIRF
jgi:hypothetical protein